MNSTEIRKRFYDYFVRHGHTQVPSSSLIPAQDPTLLFTNAGMNQFKDVFLGIEKRSYKRAVTIQKCVRAGGKHNDLDNVGFTKRHLTFFEMMGNFSFGDYFKKEAIHFAWEFLTKDLGLETKNLYATVYTTDDDSYDIWRNDIGLPKEKVIRLGEKDNFWQMGDMGPCGPSTEIHIDRGAEFGCKDLTTCGPDCDCDRFLEIWNLVFMEFDRQEDGSLKPLKHTGVDTGMGIERISSLMQDVDSVFETDLFMPLIQKIEKLTDVSYASQKGDKKAAFHVLADHIRSSSLLIADGCAPANDGRGYVLRKIIRRAALFEQKLTQSSIFPELSQTFIQSMKSIYPELELNKKLIYEILKSEIEKFSVNLERGRHILEDYLQENEKKGIKEITGTQAFTLYDTYGFPLELLTAAARERGLKVDEKAFDQLMQKQQERSGKKLTDPLDHVDIPESITTEFTGYKELETNSEIIALIDEDNQLQKTIAKGDTCWVLSKASPFFIVGGGQVPDQGWLVIGSHKAPILENRYISGRIASKIKAPAQLHVGDAIISIVDKTWRTNAMKNHTATHLLQAALIELFGKQIKQSGSLVHPDYLRFDFSYHGTLSPEDIKKVEDLVNQKIRDNIPVDVVNTTFKDAVKRGALAFFGDKYNPEHVRMIQIDEFSKELCGGTHVPHTGDIGTFKITEESSLAAGLRRIVAVTGPRAVELFQDVFADIKALGSEYKVKVNEVFGAVLKQKEQCKQLQSDYKQIKKSLNKLYIAEYKKEIEEINGVPFLYKHLDDATHEELKDIAQQLSSHRDGLYVLTSQMNGKYALFALLSNRLQDKIDLKQCATWLKDTFGIKGGGSKTQLQGGAQEIPKEFEAKIKDWVQNY